MTACTTEIHITEPWAAGPPPVGTRGLPARRPRPKPPAANATTPRLDAPGAPSTDDHAGAAASTSSPASRVPPRPPSLPPDRSALAAALYPRADRLGRGMARAWEGHGHRPDAEDAGGEAVAELVRAAGDWDGGGDFWGYAEPRVRAAVSRRLNESRRASARSLDAPVGRPGEENPGKLADLVADRRATGGLDAAVRQAADELVAAFVGRLSGDQRRFADLWFVAGLSAGRIAAELGWSLPRVRDVGLGAFASLKQLAGRAGREGVSAMIAKLPPERVSAVREIVTAAVSEAPDEEAALDEVLAAMDVGLMNDLNLHLLRAALTDEIRRAWVKAHPPQPREADPDESPAVAAPAPAATAGPCKGLAAMVAVSQAITNGILNTWKVGAKALGDATHEELLAAAEEEHDHADGHRARAAFYGLLLTRTKPRRRVRDEVSDRQATTLFQQAVKSADDHRKARRKKGA